jgi:deoxyribodipyrimidine photo-lyase
VRPSSYPAKIIAHKEGRERALAAYRDMKAQS